MILSRDRREFYERLKFTILEAEKDELDEILRTLIRKDNARQFYNELFDGCSLDGKGELAPRGFFAPVPGGTALEYAMWTLLAYAPPDFPLKRGVRSIRFVAPRAEGKPVMRFPRRLDYFPALEQLGVLGWSVSSVPRELARCSHLRYLSLRNNGFTQFPEPVLGLDKLTHLDLSQNRISTIPTGISRMAGLTSLALGGNRISSLPPALARLSRVESVDLSCNRIESVPSELAPLKGKMDLSYNDLPSREEADWSLPPS